MRPAVITTLRPNCMEFSRYSSLRPVCISRSIPQITRGFEVVTKWDANKDPVREFAANIRHSGIYRNLLPFSTLNTPIVLESQVDLFNNIANEISDSLCEFRPDHFCVYAVPDYLRMQHCVIRLEELPIDLVLVQDVVGLLEQPFHLMQWQNYFWACEDVGQDEWNSLL